MYLFCTKFIFYLRQDSRRRESEWVSLTHYYRTTFQFSCQQKKKINESLSLSLSLLNGYGKKVKWWEDSGDWGKMSDTFITLMAILAYIIGWVLYFAGAVHSLKWECSADLCSVQDRFRQDDWGGAWQWVQGICRVQGNSWHANQRKNRKNYLITFPRFFVCPSIWLSHSIIFSIYSILFHLLLDFSRGSGTRDEIVIQTRQGNGRKLFSMQVCRVSMYARIHEFFCAINSSAAHIKKHSFFTSIK